MTQELNLPVTSDGEGYSKQAVIDYINGLGHEDHSAPRIIQQAQQLLADAQDKANSIVKEANDKVANIDKEVEIAKSSKIQEIEKSSAQLVTDAENKARKTLSAADRKATNIVEEALSKVHSLVKNAQEKLENAKKQSAKLHDEATKNYSDAVSTAGTLIKNAEAHADGEIKKGHEDAAQLRIEGETMIAYAHHEAKLTLADANTKASQLMDDAEHYREQVVAQAHEEVRKAKNIIDHYKLFYQDSVSRLSALYSARYEESQALVAVEFPDSENLQGLVPEKADPFGVTTAPHAETERDASAGQEEMLQNIVDNMLASNGVQADNAEFDDLHSEMSTLSEKYTGTENDLEEDDDLDLEDEDFGKSAELSEALEALDALDLDDLELDGSEDKDVTPYMLESDSDDDAIDLDDFLDLEDEKEDEGKK